MVTRVVNLLAVSLLVTATVLAGCAKRPALTQASAPPPAAAPAPPPPPPPAARRGAGDGQGDGRGHPGARRRPRPPPPPRRPPRGPAPKEFAVNANVKDIFFDFDKYNIKPEFAKVLDSNAAWLKANPGQLVLIEGHCDERGTVEYNLALGERRAKAAMNYLVAQGVQASRFTVISYGKERPFCTEHNEACWSQNRRDHFLVKAQ